MIKGRDLNAVDKLTLKHPDFPIEIIKSGTNQDLHVWAKKNKITAHCATIEQSELCKKSIKTKIPSNSFLLIAYKRQCKSKKVSVIFAKERKHNGTTKDGQVRFSGILKGVFG